MNKKFLWLFLILTLIISLPAFQGLAMVSPEDIANYTKTGEDNDNNNLTTNDWSENYDGNTVDIIETDDQNTIILMNDTYELKVHHNETSVGVTATKLEPMLSVDADEELFDIEFNILPAGKFIDITLPTAHIELEQAADEDDYWYARINEEMYIEMNTTERYIEIYYLTSTLSVDETTIYYDDSANMDNQLILSRLSDDEFYLYTPDGIFDIYFNETHTGIDWASVPIYPLGPTAPFQWTGVAPLVSISLVDNCVLIEWEDVTIQILLDMVIIVIGAIVITWYFLLLIEMVTIVIFDITIIFYLTIVELILVLIYYTLEIKIYETQVVIVYEYIEIIFVFISISIWQLTFIFHFEFWFIQIIFLVDLVTFIIINQIRILFIPVIVPIFIPVIYYVPVIIKEYVHIYLPYAAEQMFIDVYDEDLKFPAHTIKYLVKDQLDNPIVDATVSVDYNGTNYPATHLGGGIYEVGLPASNETETIAVTATKQWYPDASLTYDLTVDWVAINETTTITEEGALPIVPIFASLFSISVCALVINRKKRN